MDSPPFNASGGGVAAASAAPMSSHKKRPAAHTPEQQIYADDDDEDPGASFIGRLRYSLTPSVFKRRRTTLSPTRASALKAEAGESSMVGSATRGASRSSVVGGGSAAKRLPKLNLDEHRLAETGGGTGSGGANSTAAAVSTLRAGASATVAVQQASNDGGNKSIRFGNTTSLTTPTNNAASASTWASP